MDMKVGATKTAGIDADQDFIRPDVWFINISVFKLSGSVVNDGLHIWENLFKHLCLGLA